MIPMPELGGWVKLHRGLLLSPVWQNQCAFRVYSSMTLLSTHKDKIVAANATAVKLLAGQLLASQADLCEVTGFSRKVVRSAVDYLARQKAVTVSGQYGKAGTVFTVHPFPFTEGEEKEKDEFSGQELRPETRPSETGVSGHGKTTEKSLCNSEFSFYGVNNCHDEMVVSRPSDRPECEPAFINKDEEVKKIRRNPLPPFAKGADGFSDSVSFVLNMWRETCEAAQVPYLEDKRTIQGAEAIARDWLLPGKAEVESIRHGMKTLLHKKTTEPTAAMFHLGTLSADVRRTGRPGLTPGANVTKMVAMRLTPTEYEEFEKDAKNAGMGMAAFARHCWHMMRKGK